MAKNLKGAPRGVNKSYKLIIDKGLLWKQIKFLDKLYFPLAENVKLLDGIIELLSTIHDQTEDK